MSGWNLASLLPWRKLAELRLEGMMEAVSVAEGLARGLRFRDYAFQVACDRGGRGWMVRVDGSTKLGPFDSEREAAEARHGLFQRWNRRARGRGGWAWRSNTGCWVVTLPDGVPCRGAPWRPEPVTVHAGEKQSK